ncbi:MAG: homoserine O-succinyltransferase MetX [Longimicrobiales bacterium]
MSIAITLSPGARICHLPALTLESGEVLDPAHIAYECHGNADSPLVIALGGISAGRHVAATADDPRTGWWEPFVGPGRALDSDRWGIAGIDWLGGAGASAGPDRTAVPATFPRITTADQAAALAALLDHLGVDRAHAIVGASYGGMVALAFAARFPDRVSRVIALGAAHRSHPRATAWRSIQRRIVRLGQHTGTAPAALALARALAVTTYRTAAEFEARFDGPPTIRNGTPRFPVEAYLEHHGRRFVEAFAPESFLRLSESLDLHDVDPTAVRAATTLIAFEDDALVPPAQIRLLARALGGPARVHEVPTIYGHDAFLKEVDALTPLIRGALTAEVAS